MAYVIGSKRRHVANRVGLYLGLTAFGLLMVFPFAVVAFGSLKTVNDVTRFPPRLLPYTQDTTEVAGEQLPLYRVDGEPRVLTETITVGDYAPPDDPTDVVRVPTSDAERVGGFMDAETVVVDGQEYDLYEITVDGQPREVIELSTTTEGVFALPDDPTDTARANERTAETIDSLAFQTSNFR